jgi:adenine-specific DNA-methyltransferase
VRYIGNKTRLREFIGRVLRARGIYRGLALDPFCGTASVARSLKRRGFQVVASDVMHYAYVFGRAYVQTAARPELANPLDVGTARPGTLRALVQALNKLPAEHGFVTDHFSPAGRAAAQHGRMYFTPENAGRIDAIRAWLHNARNSGHLSNDAFFVLLAALLEAADRVANTTGVYAAFVKSWQPNAVRPLALRLEPIVKGNSCHAYQRDALDVVRAQPGFELLYLDPPYNARQYPGYYHIPELIATGWFENVPVLRGKTGLPPANNQRSVWCSRRKATQALEELLAAAHCKHIVMSYNTEGIIAESSIEQLLKESGRRATYQRYEHSYRRYRSDSDREGRRYRGDDVKEYLYCVSR